MIFLVKLSLHMLSAMWKAAELLLGVSRGKNNIVSTEKRSVLNL